MGELVRRFGIGFMRLATRQRNAEKRQHRLSRQYRKNQPQFRVGPLNAFRTTKMGEIYARSPMPVGTVKSLS
jgi:hypothetical protein